MLRLTLFNEIDPAPTKTMLVGGLLGAGEMSCFFGAPGSGKSVLLGDICAHVAANAPWCGRAVTGGAVLYIAAERAMLVKRRFAAWRQHHGLEDIPLGIVDGVIDLRTPAAAKDIIDAVQRLADAYRQEVTLIGIDTVSRVLAGGDENSPKDMGALIANVGRLQEATKAHVALCHHVPHDVQRMRGHGSLLGAIDTGIHVEKLSAGRTASVTKQSDGPEDESVSFTLQSVEIGRDDAGDVTTAPIVVPLDTPLKSRAVDKTRPMTKAATTALRALHEALAETGEQPPHNGHIPGGVTVTTLDRWRDYAYRMGISASDEPQAKRKAFQRGSEHLIGAQHVGVWEPYVWAVG